VDATPGCMPCTSIAIISVRDRHPPTCNRGSGSLARAMITKSRPVSGCCCCVAGSVILKEMLDAAAGTEMIKLRTKAASENLVQRGARFMVSPEN
jgi:hypothetical protein